MQLVTCFETYDVADRLSEWNEDSVCVYVCVCVCVYQWYDRSRILQTPKNPTWRLTQEDNKHHGEDEGGRGGRGRRANKMERGEEEEKEVVGIREEGWLEGQMKIKEREARRWMVSKEGGDEVEGKRGTKTGKKHVRKELRRWHWTYTISSSHLLI